MLFSESASNARILVVDDQPANVRLLQRLLGFAGYTQIFSTTDPRDACALFQESDPDLVLLDLRMPHVDGLTLLAELNSRIPDGNYLPIVVLTADITEEAKEQALSLGANDFLTKPLQTFEVLLRIRNLLATRFLHRRLKQHNNELEIRVRERTIELEEARLDVLERLTQAAEFRDDETGQHTRRVGEEAAKIARALDLPSAEVELILRAAPLHDVGKIAIPDSVLLKPGALTPEEFAVMKTHTTRGADMLAGGRSELIHLARDIALSHHERWDGAGYPNGLAGEAIPLAGRIVALADFHDALSHDRPYRLAWPADRVWTEIERETGRHFDPRVVEAFRRVHRCPASESPALSGSNTTADHDR